MICREEERERECARLLCDATIGTIETLRRMILAFGLSQLYTRDNQRFFVDKINIKRIAIDVDLSFLYIYFNQVK